MHIAINAQLLNDEQTYRSAGVSNYCRHLLLNLGKINQERGTNQHLRAFIGIRSFQAPGIALESTIWPLRQPLARIVWEQLVLPRHLQQPPADLVHGLVNVLPLATRIPGVVTVHDLSFLHMPEKFPRLKRYYLTQLCAASVRQARHIIAVSQQTADDLMRSFGLAAHRISVVHNGVATAFTPGDPAAVAQFRRQRGLPDRYIFYLGTLEPRKNLERLVQAFAQWQQQPGNADQQIKLVLAGAKGWFYQEIFQLVASLKLEQQVLFPGFIAETELPDWYRAAEVFVYPSFFEGFGLPVLEAMSCGVPVLCSEVASLLEVAGSSALTFPPTDTAALGAGLDALIKQPALRAQLRQAGLMRAGQFSWRQTAEQTWAVYERTVS